MAQARCRVCGELKPPGLCKPCRRAYNRAYGISEKGRAGQRAYRTSEQGRAVIRAYRTSEQGHARARATREAYKYDLAPGEREAMYKDQGGRCAQCRRRIPSAKLHIDHCHYCAKINLRRSVRGLICNSCNLHHRDDAATHRARADYLDPHEAVCPAWYWLIDGCAPEVEAA